MLEFVLWGQGTRRGLFPTQYHFRFVESESIPRLTSRLFRMLTFVASSGACPVALSRPLVYRPSVCARGGFTGYPSLARRRFASATPPAAAAGTATMSARKPGVSSPDDLRAHVAAAAERLLVVDVRNPDASVEPGDAKSIAGGAPLPGSSEAAGSRPQAVNLVFDRESGSLPLPDVPKDTPIITHCGGGGRGQKAKDYLVGKGFTSVLNGGGPEDKECWAEFGHK